MVFRLLKSLSTARPAGAGRSPHEIRDLIRSLREQPPDERRGANVSLTDPGVDEAFVPVLVEATRDGDAYIRASAAHALGHYPLATLRKACGALLAALRTDTDSQVRVGAAEALGCCAAQCTGALIDALADTSPQVRASVVSSLAMAGTDQAIEAVTRSACTDREAEVRRRAVYELGVMKDERWLDVLLQATRDTDEQVRADALYALRQTGRDESDALVTVFIDAVSDPSACVREQACYALRYSQSQAVPALMRALADEDARVRLEAVISLGSLDAADAVDAIAGLMQSDPDEEVRSYAASALSDIRHPKAVQYLARPNASATEGVQQRAARIEALGGTRSAAALPVLCEALGDAAVEVRLGAARGLGSLLLFSKQDPDAVLPALCQAVEDVDVDVRREVIGALAQIRGIQAGPALLRACADPDADVRAQAYLALPGSLSTGLEDVLVKGLGDGELGVRRAAAAGLARCVPSRRWSELLPWLQDARVDVITRGSLAEAIARTGEPGARAALVECLADESSQVRMQLCTALQEGEGRQFVEPLIALLDDEDDGVRAEAALALASTADGRAFEPLKRLLLREETAAVRRRVVWASSFFSRQECLPLLVHALLDPDEHVREQAVLALAQVSSAEELADLLKQLPRRVTDDVRAALAQAIDDACGQDGGASKQVRRVHIGTVHYE
jgi:HEAT repeat protein